MVVLHLRSPELTTQNSSLRTAKRISKRDVERHLEIRKVTLGRGGRAGMRKQDTRRSTHGIERRLNAHENVDATNLQQVRVEHGCAWFIRRPGSILQNGRVEGYGAIAEVIEP